MNNIILFLNVWKQRKGFVSNGVIESHLGASGGCRAPVRGDNALEMLREKEKAWKSLKRKMCWWLLLVLVSVKKEKKYSCV